MQNDICDHTFSGDGSGGSCADQSAHSIGGGDCHQEIIGSRQHQNQYRRCKDKGGYDHDKQKEHADQGSNQVKWDMAQFNDHIPECHLIEGAFSAKTADIDDVYNVYDRCGKNAGNPEKRRMLPGGDQDGKEGQIRPYSQKDRILFFHFEILLSMKIYGCSGLRTMTAEKDLPSQWQRSIKKYYKNTDLCQVKGIKTKGTIPGGK